MNFSKYQYDYFQMTELIKEQLFQHQMTQSKEEEIAAMETPSGQWPSEGSISGPHSLYGDESIQESLSDVRLFFRERKRKRERERERQTDKQTEGDLACTASHVDSSVGFFEWRVISLIRG